MSSPFKVRPESWPRVSALLDQALELSSDDRAALIARVAAEDAELAAELSRLLPGVAAASDAAGPSDASSPPFATLLCEALAADPAAVDATGTSFGAWTLVAKLGAGGMGEVWRAARSDGLFAGTAAIKLLRSDLPAARLAARFARERSMLARLNHPNIARLLDAGIANGQAFIVLELVEGTPLLRFAAEHTFTLASRVRLIRDIARAVEHAHSQLVLHRDLKPSNVLVTSNGTVKLLDFGIAAALDETAVDETSSSLTQLTGRGLTLEYAAPEQILGEPTIAASDVYSLGVMLFHLATGQRPFATSANRAALEYSIVHDEAPRASVSVLSAEQTTQTTGTARDAIAPPGDSSALRGDLDAVIAKALRKSPPERYATAAAFAADLDAWLQHSPISIRAEERSYRTRLWLRRNWALATLGGVAAAAVFAGLSVSLWQRSEAIAAAARATDAAQLAKDEAARATKVADYLGELIQSANPDNHKGAWPTVIVLLEQAEKDLDEKFKDDPKTKSLLLERFADTNNTLNRDTVSLAQYEALLKGFEQAGETKTERAIDARKNYATLLKRVDRDEDAFRQFEILKPLTASHYGLRSEQYATLQLSIAVEMAHNGRLDEARKLLAEGTALMQSLHPNDVRKRLDLTNDAAIMLTRAGMWREAEATLSVNEKDLPLLANLGGAAVRDALIQRNNLEAIRIRLGKTDGADERLRVNASAARTLFGGENPITYRSEELRQNIAGTRGDFETSMRMLRERMAANTKQKGQSPLSRLEDELLLLRGNAIHTRLTGANSHEPGGETLASVVAAISKEIPQSGGSRAGLYRTAADVAIMQRKVDVARDMVRRAREDARIAAVGSPDRLAQIERAAAAVAFAENDAARAITLLQPRFDWFKKSNEGDTPRHATLWLQRALYATGVDVNMAAEAAATSRRMFAASGGTPPHFAALLAYVDARVSGDKSAIRAAEDRVDAAFLRIRPTPWHWPHQPSI